ncbi:hypothetical protein A2U01_0026341, partial [Trifolium medium]|nr:hypothetical protein [Trifolium medium]
MGLSSSAADGSSYCFVIRPRL